MISKQYFIQPTKNGVRQSFQERGNYLSNFAALIFSKFVKAGEGVNGSRKKI